MGRTIALATLVAGTLELSVFFALLVFRALRRPLDEA